MENKTLGENLTKYMFLVESTRVNKNKSQSRKRKRKPWIQRLRLLLKMTETCDAITTGTSATSIPLDTGETTLKCTHFCVEAEEREVNLDAWILTVLNRLSNLKTLIVIVIKVVLKAFLDRSEQEFNGRITTYAHFKQTWAGTTSIISTRTEPNPKSHPCGHWQP